MDNNDIENIPIENVALLDTDAAGDLYMEKLFPLWTDVVVFTLEGKYPVDSNLRARTLEKIKNDQNLNLFIYGAKSEKFETASQRRLDMHGLFSLDLRRYPWQQPVLELDEYKIIEICRVSRGKKDLERLQSYNLYIEVMMPDSVKWYHDLVKS